MKQDYSIHGRISIVFGAVVVNVFPNVKRQLGIEAACCQLVEASTDQGDGDKVCPMVSANTWLLRKQGMLDEFQHIIKYFIRQTEDACQFPRLNRSRECSI